MPQPGRTPAPQPDRLEALGFVKEATLRDFFYGTITAEVLAAEVQDAVVPMSRLRRVHIQDLPGDEQVAVTAEMLVRLCDAVIRGELPGTALETIAFTIIVSDHLHWAKDDELVGRVLYDWASWEFTWDLTTENVRMFREWLTGDAQPPSEPEVTTDTLSGGGFLKVLIQPEENADRS
jgi:hypothetical protein